MKDKFKNFYPYLNLDPRSTHSFQPFEPFKFFIMFKNLAATWAISVIESIKEKPARLSANNGPKEGYKD